MTFLLDHSAVWGEHPGVYNIAYEHDVHLKIMNYELYVTYTQ